jgi:hypothetical protein
MKIKKNSGSESSAPTTSGAVIADRFKLDVDPNANKEPAGVNKTAAAIAMVAALTSMVLMGVVAALMYVNWDLIKDV